VVPLSFNLHKPRKALISSTAATILHQLVMFVVDNLVEEDLCPLHDNELESITLPGGTTETLGHPARDALSIFEHLFLLGNGESAQFLLFFSFTSLRLTLGAGCAAHNPD
jgi:hypothetical protein